MSFGLREVAPLLPDFLEAFPEVSVDLHLSDALMDLVGEGFDAALRIGALPDSSLVARRLRPIPILVVAAPSYLKARGTPETPGALGEHDCLGYAYAAQDRWRFVGAKGEEAVVRPKERLRATSGDALMPALLAGHGIAALPAFIVQEAVSAGALVALLTDWSLSSAALFLVTPTAGPRPMRVTALLDFFTRRLEG